MAELMHHIAVDSYGSCLHNRDLPAAIAPWHMLQDPTSLGFLRTRTWSFSAVPQETPWACAEPDCHYPAHQPGPCLHQIPSSDVAENTGLAQAFYDFVATYKFTVAWENCPCDDYGKGRPDALVGSLGSPF